MAFLHNEHEQDETVAPNRSQPGQSSGLLAGYAQANLPLQMSNIYGTGGSAPSATGHVNFDRIYAANEGTAQRDAGNMASAAAKGAQGARSGLAGLQQQFSSQSKAAAGVAPNAAQQDWAAHGQTGVTQPKKVTAAYYTPSGQSNVNGPRQEGSSISVPGVFGGAVNNVESVPNATISQTGTPTSGDDGSQQSYVSENQEGFGSEGAGVTRDAQGNVVSATGPRDATADAATEAAVRAGAAGQYAGPGSLSDMEGYKGLLDKYRSAQGNLNALQDDAHIQGQLEASAQGPYIEGGSRLDAALTGAAGRERFANLRQQYKGLGGDVGAANKASLSEADANRSLAEQNAAAKQGLLDQYLGRQSADQSQADATNASSDKRIADAQQHAKNVHDFEYAMNGGTGFDKFRNGIHDVARFLSPVDAAFHAAGEKAPVEYGTDYFGSTFGADQKDKYNYGNKSEVWAKGDEDVFAAMTPADWTEFNALGPNEQRAWIEARKKKMKGG